ncbi:hypothetical protein [Erythrobacter sp.]|uniref:hypothetical protein n=1 Tax=Erythrobacter sp. TaxID=1042 RepID=UPI002EB99C9E|nr:hypothetical protein [Erythrobacter sp.]
MSRLKAAVERIDAARLDLSAERAETGHEARADTGSDRVLALVNAHERLREEVADTIGEIDTLIEELSGE